MHFFIIEAEERHLDDFKRLFTKCNIKAKLVKPLKCTGCGNFVKPDIKITTEDECPECILKVFEDQN